MFFFVFIILKIFNFIIKRVFNFFNNNEIMILCFMNVAGWIFL